MQPEVIASIVSVIAAALGGAGTALSTRHAARNSDPLGRQVDQQERLEYVEMVASAASQADGPPATAATVLDRFRARSERREAMMERDIENNLRLRKTYRWLFLILFGIGVVPLVLGIWFIVLGSVPAGAISTAAGVFLEVTGLFSRGAAKDADSTAEKRISELERSQDKNDSLKLPSTLQTRSRTQP